MKIAGAVPASLPLLHPHAASGSAPSAPPAKGPAIKSISIFRAGGHFSRFVGMNAYDTAAKGTRSAEDLVRVRFADGTEGLSVLGYSPVNDEVVQRMKALIGKDPFRFYTWQGDRITGVAEEMKPYFFDTWFAWIEGAVLDALGKLGKVPVWRLFGNPVRDGVDVYDGALYFEEIALGTDLRVIAETGKKIKAEGYRGIKMKMGRCSKWLPGEAGVNRDIEAFIALREAVGWNVNIMADANNAYAGRFDWAVKLMKACAPYQLYWMEELFPDDTPMYRKLRGELLADQFFIPIAEGESLMGDDDVRQLSRFDKYLTHGVYHFLQPDMRTYGFSNMLGLSKKALQYPHVKIAPHNWSSQMGMIMSLHASKISANMNLAEDDRFSNEAILTTGYGFKEGQFFVPDEPGWGISLIPDRRQPAKEGERVIAD